MCRHNIHSISFNLNMLKTNLVMFMMLTLKHSLINSSDTSECFPALPVLSCCDSVGEKSSPCYLVYQFVTK